MTAQASATSKWCSTANGKQGIKGPRVTTTGEAVRINPVCLFRALTELIWKARSSVRRSIQFCARVHIVIEFLVALATIIVVGAIASKVSSAG
jgi:hypothetical protein